MTFIRWLILIKTLKTRFSQIKNLKKFAQIKNIFVKKEILMMIINKKRFSWIIINGE